MQWRRSIRVLMDNYIRLMLYIVKCSILLWKVTIRNDTLKKSCRRLKYKIKNVNISDILRHWRIQNIKINPFHEFWEYYRIKYDVARSIDTSDQSAKIFVDDFDQVQVLLDIWLRIWNASLPRDAVEQSLEIRKYWGIQSWSDPGIFLTQRVILDRDHPALRALSKSRVHIIRRFCTEGETKKQ